MLLVKHVYGLLATLAVLTLGATSACFDPPEPACAFYCSVAGACPDGYRCASDQWCKRLDIADNYECGPSPADDGGLPVPFPVDAAGPDAAPVDGAPADATPVDAASADATPADATPADTADAGPPDASSLR